MYRVSKTASFVTVTDFRWPWAVLCVVFLLTTVLGAWEAYVNDQLNLFKSIIAVLAIFGMGMGAVLFSRHTTYVVNLEEKKLTWRRSTLGRQTGGELMFSDIDSVGLQSLQQSTLTLTRVVVYSAKGDIPLSSVFSGRYDDNKNLAAAIREMIWQDGPGSSEDLITQSILEMVKRRQTLQATALLTRGGMPLNEARERVRRLLAQLESEDGGRR